MFIVAEALKFHSQEPRLQVGRGQPAGFLFAKPPVAVAGDPVINGIAERPWHDEKHLENRPKPTQFSHDPQRHVRAGVGPAAVHQHDCVQLAGRQMVRLQEPLPRLRLQGCEAELRRWVVLDDPLHRAVAEVTNAIKKQDGALRR